MSAAPLVLIPFVSTEVQDSLGAVLTDLGYATRPPSPMQVGDGPIAGWPGALVLLLGNADWPREQVLATLGRHPGVPSLALVAGDNPDWNYDLLASCADWTRWPCGREELGIRLKRLCAPTEPTQAPALDPELARTLQELNLVGRSPAFVQAMETVRRLIRCDAPVLISGETGTGKELVARAIHYLGARASGPFVPINCGALPDHLVENELFGHERGAYTDARTAELGAIGEAAGGTLFLDEVEALSPKAQSALLRFLQDREYRPLGGRRARHADTRVIAATNADLRDLSERRAFRPDLYFRLDILSVDLPPLRARERDVELLAKHFLALYARQYDLPPIALDRRCIPALQEYPWPGNVRELENLIHRQALLAESPQLFLRPGAPPQDLHSPEPRDGRSTSAEPGSFAAAKTRAIEIFERSYLTRLMAKTQGNVSQAARIADKERRALGKLLKKYAIGSARPD